VKSSGKLHGMAFTFRHFLILTETEMIFPSLWWVPIASWIKL